MWPTIAGIPIFFLDFLFMSLLLHVFYNNYDFVLHFIMLWLCSWHWKSTIKFVYYNTSPFIIVEFLVVREWVRGQHTQKCEYIRVYYGLHFN